MVNIDTVYQRVLAFANKEQRGYITPQEFNLFANQAQMEIFEQYFYMDFELHPAEESELVYKILKYAGASMKREDVSRVGVALESQQIQQEKQ
jgi:hypothetical protein